MNTIKPDKDKVLTKIQFLEEQLVSLDHYLPETYEFLLQGLDQQKRILAELDVTEAFESIDLLQTQHQKHQ